MNTITLDASIGYAIALLRSDDGRSLMIQQAADAPGVARDFGWRMRPSRQPRDARGRWVACGHLNTDGTIRCPDCGAPAADFVEAALRYLDAHHGETAEDPGYFPRTIEPGYRLR